MGYAPCRSPFRRDCCYRRVFHQPCRVSCSSIGSDRNAKLWNCATDASTDRSASPLHSVCCPGSASSVRGSRPSLCCSSRWQALSRWDVDVTGAVAGHLRVVMRCTFYWYRYRGSCSDNNSIRVQFISFISEQCRTILMDVCVCIWGVASTHTCFPLFLLLLTC